MRVGFVGYSDDTKFNKDDAVALVKRSFDIIASKNPVVVSGLTNVGIPAIVYAEAASRGLRTAGIACSKAEEYECFPVDEKLIVGKEWGEESQTFLKNIDFLIKIGGGDQSVKEYAEYTGPKVELKL